MLSQRVGEIMSNSQCIFGMSFFSFFIQVEGTDKESAKKMDENIKIACNLYAHLVLCYRNTLKKEIGFRSYQVVIHGIKVY